MCYEKGETFADLFATMTVIDPRRPPRREPECKQLLTKVEVTREHGGRLLRELDVEKVTRPNDVSNSVLNHYTSELS